jgi:hypothetical protein
MIAIVNIDENPRAFGEHLYSLRINQRELCKFKHKREDGISTCLMKAAKEIEKNKWEVFYEEDMKK